MTNAEDEMQPEQLPMIPDRIRQAALAELDRQARMVGAIRASDWSRPSAAAGWSVGDVVAHLSLAMRLQSQLLGATTAGKSTGGIWKTMGELTRAVAPTVAPALHAVNSAIPKLLDRTLTQEAVVRQFESAAAGLRERLERVAPDEYSRQIYYVGGPWPLSFFLGHILNELAVHGWDIATTLHAQARLSDDACSVLPWFYWSGTPFMLRPPTGSEGAVQVLLAEPEMEMWWRFGGGKKEQGMGQQPGAGATINSNAGTFVLTLSGRLKPLDALRFAAIEVRGNDELARTFLGSWHVV